MLNMRVKTLGYKFVGVDRKEIKLFKMATGQIKGSPQLSQANDRDITLKNKIYFLQFKEMILFFFLE